MCKNQARKRLGLLSQSLAYHIFRYFHKRNSIITLLLFTFFRPILSLRFLLFTLFKSLGLKRSIRVAQFTRNEQNFPWYFTRGRKEIPTLSKKISVSYTWSLVKIPNFLPFQINLLRKTGENCKYLHFCVRLIPARV